MSNDSAPLPEASDPVETETRADLKPERIRQIVIGVVFVLVLFGAWAEKSAYRECDEMTEAFMYRLEGRRVFDDQEVHAIIGRAPDISEEHSRYGGLMEEYIWQGVFHTYHLRLIYTWNMVRFELDGVRSYSRKRWDGAEPPGSPEGQSDLVQLESDRGMEEEVRRMLRKGTGEITREEMATIQELNLSGSQVRDLSWLQHMPELRVLQLDDNRLTDITGLRKVNSLEVLRLQFNSLTDLDDILHLKQLKDLDAGHNRLTHTDAFLQLTDLERLVLKHNQIESVGPLGQLGKLQFLDLNENQISDLTPLGKLRNLQILRLSSNRISNLKGLADLPALEVLYLSGNQIEILEPLSKIPSLRRLYISGNRITDLSPLEKMDNLFVLEIRENPVSAEAVDTLRRALPGCRIVH